MNTKFIVGAVCLIAMSAVGAGCSSASSIETPADNPVASKQATVTAGNARFTVLTPRMVRVEYSDKGIFEDQATFTVINRELPVPHFDVAETDSTLDIRTDNMRLHYCKGHDPRLDPAALTAYRDNAPTWHYGMADTENLKGTMRTLDGYDGSKGPLPLDNGILSRSGWSVIDDSPGNCPLRRQPLTGFWRRGAGRALGD